MDRNIPREMCHGICVLFEGRQPTTKKPSIVPKVTTTTPPPRPTIDTGSSVSAFCRNPVFDAIDIVNGSIHVFYGKLYAPQSNIRQQFVARLLVQGRLRYLD